MKAVGFIITKVIAIAGGNRKHTGQVKAITHRLYYKGDWLGNVRVVLAFEESH